MGRMPAAHLSTGHWEHREFRDPHQLTLRDGKEGKLGAIRLGRQNETGEVIRRAENDQGATYNWCRNRPQPWTV